MGALIGATLVSVLSAANVFGRLLWTALSDLVGRRGVFLAMFMLQTLTLLLLGGAKALVPFALLGMVVLLCYGVASGRWPRSWMAL